MQNQPLTIANRQFNSRLMLGTGKFASGELMREAGFSRCEPMDIRSNVLSFYAVRH